MKIEIKQRDDIHIVRLTGRLDASTMAKLEKELVPLCQEEESRVIVDCKGLEYVSSAGLRVMLSALKATHQTSGGLALCNLRDNVTQVFEISGFSRIFALFNSVEEAASALRGEAAAS